MIFAVWLIGDKTPYYVNVTDELELMTTIKRESFIVGRFHPDDEDSSRKLVAKHIIEYQKIK